MLGMSPANREGSLVKCAFDPQAPYTRLAVVGLIERPEAAQDALQNGSADIVPDLGPPKSIPAERWLLLRQANVPERWDPPGGRVERGEDLRQAVLREIREETGLAVEVAGPCYAYLTFHKGERLIAISMACRVVEGAEMVRLEPENAVAWQWATSKEWQCLARQGKSSWAPEDVECATRLAQVLWSVLPEHFEPRSEGG